MYVFAPRTDAALGVHVARAGGTAGPGRRALRCLPGMRATGTPARRIVAALRACCDLVATHQPEAIAVLSADHILQLDLRPLAAAHGELGADVTLVTLPLAASEVTGRTVLRIGVDGQVGEARRARSARAASNGTGFFALGWAGDFVVRAEALPAVLSALAMEDVRDDARLLATLAARLRMMAYDPLDNHLPGASHGAYWHEPTTLEAYYAAQMDLCTPRPLLDLYNPAWPVRAAASGLASAKVVADPGGRAGQALNSLVSDPGRRRLQLGPRPRRRRRERRRGRGQRAARWLPDRPRRPRPSRPGGTRSGGRGRRGDRLRRGAERPGPPRAIGAHGRDGTAGRRQPVTRDARWRGVKTHHLGSGALAPAHGGSRSSSTSPAPLSRLPHA